jgi:hypothetical protein
MESGRFFNDLTEGLLRGIFETQAEVELIRVWMTDDARQERREQRWLNAIARRCIPAK